MKRATVLLILSAVLSLAAADPNLDTNANQADNAQEVESSAPTKAKTPDPAPLRERVSLLPPTNASLSELLDALGPCEFKGICWESDCGVRAIGFDLQLARAHDSRCGIGLWYDIIAYKNQIADITVAGINEKIPLDCRELLDQAFIGYSKKEDGRSVEWHFRDRALTQTYLQAVERNIGEVPAVEIPPELRKHYDYLRDIKGEVHFGRICYVGGDEPDGRAAINAIMAAKRYDIVRAILRGLNPEGRVYAAEALRSMPRSEQVDEDEAVIQKIMALDIPIRCCDGCIVSNRTAREILDRATDTRQP